MNNLIIKNSINRNIYGTFPTTIPVPGTVQIKSKMNDYTMKQSYKNIR